jgi:hypothetical protein
MKRLFPLALLAFVAVPASGILAEEGVSLPAIDHGPTLAECGACHMAFPPQLLPARSWERIMSDLADHFGEDASLAEPVRADIAAYLVAHAADAPGTAEGDRFLRRLEPTDIPLRITEAPFWVRDHDEIAADRFASAEVKTRSNCIACHKTADRGEFFEPEDDD